MGGNYPAPWTSTGELFTPNTTQRRPAPSGYAPLVSANESSTASVPLGWLWQQALQEWT